MYLFAFETRPDCVALDSLEPGLRFSSQSPSCFCLCGQSAGIKVECHTPDLFLVLVSLEPRILNESVYIIFVLLKKATKDVTVPRVLDSHVTGTLVGEKRGLAKLYLKGLGLGEQSHAG